MTITATTISRITSTTPSTKMTSFEITPAQKKSWPIKVKKKYKKRVNDLAER